MQAPRDSPAAVVAAELELCLRARRPVIYLVTAEERRALALLEATASRLGRGLFAWTQTRGLGPALADAWDARLCDPVAALEHVRAGPARGVYAMLDLHAFLTNPTVARKLRDVTGALAGAGATVVVVAPTLQLPPELAADVVVLDLPPPDAGELAARLDDWLARAPAAVNLAPAERDALVRASRGLALGELEAALATAAAGTSGTFASRAAARVEREKQQRVRKSGVLEFVAPGDGLGDVGGLDALKRWLEARARAFGDAARRFGLPAPRGLLLVGVPGAGKSLCARSAARAWSLPLLRLDVGRLFAGTVGASEANLRHALATAETVAPCVLWVDEIDKAFAGVGGSAAADAGTAARVFGAFVTWLQEKQAPVFVIATANAVDGLPPELVRKGRFDETFFLDLPAAAERLEILRIHVERRGREPSAFDLEALAEASEGCSGAELEAAVVAGLYHAFEAGRPLETRDVLRALGESVALARTAGERLAALRRWAEGRARPASAAAAVAGRRVAV